MQGRYHGLPSFLDPLNLYKLQKKQQKKHSGQLHLAGQSQPELCLPLSSMLSIFVDSLIDILKAFDSRIHSNVSSSVEMSSSYIHSCVTGTRWSQHWVFTTLDVKINGKGWNNLVQGEGCWVLSQSAKFPGNFCPCGQQGPLKREQLHVFNASTRFIYCTKKSPIVVRLYIYIMPLYSFPFYKT